MLVQAPIVHLTDTAPPKSLIHVDALQLQQIMLNLLKNALDASPQVHASPCEIHVAVECEGLKARISVQDHGTGISAEAREHLFEPFYTTKDSGLGLGLSICRSIAEAHSGRLEVLPAHSEPGTVFVLTLPCRHE